MIAMLKRQILWFLIPIVLLPAATFLTVIAKPLLYTATTDLLILPIAGSTASLNPEGLLHWLNTPGFREKVRDKYSHKFQNKSMPGYRITYSLNPSHSMLNVAFSHPNKAIAMTMTGELASLITSESETLTYTGNRSVKVKLQEKISGVRGQLANIKKLLDTATDPGASPLLLLQQDSLENRLIELQTNMDQLEATHGHGPGVKASGAVSIKRPESPWKAVAFAVALAPIVGYLLALGVSHQQGRLYDLSDVEAFLNLPVIQTIRKDKLISKNSKKSSPKTRSKNPLKSLKSEGSSLPGYPSISPLTQKTLYQELLGVKCHLHHMGQVGHKILSVVSPKPASGTTFLVANLAKLYADCGMKTLVVEGNLRNPEIHTVFGVHQAAGLADLLDGKVHAKEILQQKDPNLFVIAAGSVEHDPLYYLSHQNIAVIFDHLQRFFDVILINTPSNFEIPDGPALAQISQNVLLNVKQDDLTRPLLSKWLRQLNNIKTKNLGIIVNFATVS